MTTLRFDYDLSKYSDTDRKKTHWLHKHALERHDTYVSRGYEVIIR